MTIRTVDNRGFTLAEILIASTISSFIALAAVGALKAVTDSSQVVNLATETAGEVRFAAQMVARDLGNLYRDPDTKSMKLVGTSQESDAAGPAMLTFYATGCSKARVGQPEGDVYEVEYFLAKNEKTEPAEDKEQAEKFVLFRRLWPNPDKERNPGGVLTPIAENIDVFAMRFFDGKQWVTQWPEELQSIPEMVEVTLVTQPKERGSPVIEKFTVNFPRFAGKAAAGSGEGLPGEQAGGQPPQEGQPQTQGNQGTPGSPEQR
jgi:general secretion pathway protein J